MFSLSDICDIKDVIKFLLTKSVSPIDSNNMTDLPKLHYFPIAGRAEAIRLAAVLGNVRFEEVC